MNTCPECGKTASDTDTMRDWYWVRRGGDGFWACTPRCLFRHLLKLAKPVEQWLPTAEDEERMGQ